MVSGDGVPAPRRVLVVEDEALTRLLVIEMLETAGLAAEIIATQAEEIAQIQAFLDGSGSAAEGHGSASPSAVALSTPLDHVHAAVQVESALLIDIHRSQVAA